MIRYNAGDNIAYEKCRSKLLAHAIPPRTHVRWDLEVAFGNADGTNDWTMTPSAQWASDGSRIITGGSPVLFWQVKSNNQSHPPLGMSVDTDSSDPTKLMITFSARVGGATSPIELGRARGLSRHQLISIVVEAFLDERSTTAGGKGLLKVWVDGAPIVDKTGATLSTGPNVHEWSIEMYLWNEPRPYAHTRASFWKTAEFFVYPVGSMAAPRNLRVVR